MFRTALSLQGRRAFSVSAAPRPSNSILNNIFGASKTPRVPMSTPFPGVTEPTVTKHEPLGEIKIHTSENGMRIVTREEPSSLVSSVGVYFDAGSRFEVPETNGITSLMEAMAFKTTETRDDFAVIGDMSRNGGYVSCNGQREVVQFQGEIMSDKIEFMMASLADSIQNTLYLRAEILDALHALKIRHDITTRDLETSLTNSWHSAAYGSHGLGLRPDGIISNMENSFSTGYLQKWARCFYAPERAVISAVGVEHTSFVELCEEVFTFPRPYATAEKVPAVYRPGQIRTVHTEDANVVHYVFGLEGRRWADDDFLPMCVLQMMMGGGGSFSSGGPGKGMFTRMYQLLSQYHFVQSAQTYAHIYNDTALFGIQASTSPEFAPQLVQIVQEEAQKMTGSVEAEELARAKAQLKSSVLMQLESRLLMQEDMARQLLTMGKIQSPAELCQKIDAVTADDIVNVAKKMLSDKPVHAASGDLSYFPAL